MAGKKIPAEAISAGMDLSSRLMADLNALPVVVGGCHRLEMDGHHL